MWTGKLRTGNDPKSNFLYSVNLRCLLIFHCFSYISLFKALLFKIDFSGWCPAVQLYWNDHASYCFLISFRRDKKNPKKQKKKKQKKKLTQLLTKFPCLLLGWLGYQQGSFLMVWDALLVYIRLRTKQMLIFACEFPLPAAELSGEAGCSLPPQYSFYLFQLWNMAKSNKMVQTLLHLSFKSHEQYQKHLGNIREKNIYIERKELYHNLGHTLWEKVFFN